MTSTINSTLRLSNAALENVEETGIDPMSDVARLRAGEVTEDDLLAECLDGADDDRVQGWREYVDAVVAYVSLDGVSATLDLDAPALDDLCRAARAAGRAQVEIDLDLVSLDEMARGRHDQTIILDAIALAAGYEVGALRGLPEDVRDSVVESYTLAYAERVSDHQRADAAVEA